MKHVNTPRDRLEVTVGELREACYLLKTRRAPRPSGILSQIIKILIICKPGMFIYYRPVSQKCFPDEWKMVRLILLPKGDKTLQKVLIGRYVIDLKAKLYEQLASNSSKLKNTGLSENKPIRIPEKNICELIALI